MTPPAPPTAGHAAHGTEIGLARAPAGTRIVAVTAIAAIAGFLWNLVAALLGLRGQPRSPMWRARVGAAAGIREAQVIRFMRQIGEDQMFNKILCATDGSPDADRALALAGALAADSGAAIDVVHVIEYFSGGRVAGLTTRANEPEIRARIDEQIAASAAHGLTSVTHVPHAAAGKTARRIADLAEELGTEVIVVGTRGHSAVAGAMLGSVTQRLLHEAPCPVLAVPPMREAEPAPRAPEAAAVAE